MFVKKHSFKPEQFHLYTCLGHMGVIFLLKVFI